MRKVELLTCLLILLISCMHTEATETVSRHDVFPEPIGFVNDFEDILSSEEEDILSKSLTEYEVVTAHEIAIVTVPDIQPYSSMFEYSLDLANYWGIGKKEVNNGVLIALSKNLRNIHIQNGKGVEDLFTDVETKALLDSLVIPEFKKDEYFQGLHKAIKGIMLELNDK